MYVHCIVHFVFDVIKFNKSFLALGLIYVTVFNEKIDTALFFPRCWRRGGCGLGVKLQTKLGRSRLRAALRLGLTVFRYCTRLF